VSFLQALFYFLGEALINLRRGWRTSLFAVLTIATSFFVGGAFLLVGGNAGRIVAEWRGDARVILYLSDAVGEEERSDLQRAMLEREEVESAVLVSGEQAETRFREFFPRMVEVLDEAEEMALPASLEIGLRDSASVDRRVWLTEWETDPRIDSVDDDVEWLSRLDRGLAALRVVAGTLWLVLAAGTMITIASLVRLSAFAYREEIEVMRLVGATEFVIRCPFYLEGVIQGLLGSGLAVLALFGAHSLLASRPTFALSEALIGDFLSLPVWIGVVLVGGLAGLVGALISVPRE